jgi:hypothetical protein
MHATLTRFVLFTRFSGCSLNSVFLAKGASVLPKHAHLFPTETSVLDRHAEERVFVLLIVGSKGVLMEQHQFRFIRARFREVGKILSDGRDQVGLPLHALVTVHRHVLSQRAEGAARAFRI